MSARKPFRQSRARRRARFALAVSLVWAPLAIVGMPVASDSGEARAAMADAMSRMMEAMGFLGSGAESARSMASGQMPGLSGMPSWGMPGWGMMPGSMGMPGWPGMSAPFGGGDPMGQAGRMGEALMEQMPQGIPGMPPGMAMPQMPQLPWSGGLLEGVWEGASGGVLIVQGPYYRLYSPTGGFIDGRLELKAGELRLYNSGAGFDRRFDYALDQGRMALRDEGGQVFLYRQLVLDGGEGPADQPSPR